MRQLLYMLVTRHACSYGDIQVCLQERCLSLVVCSFWSHTTFSEVYMFVTVEAYMFVWVLYVF